MLALAEAVLVDVAERVAAIVVQVDRQVAIELAQEVNHLGNGHRSATLVGAIAVPAAFDVQNVHCSALLDQLHELENAVPLALVQAAAVVAAICQYDAKLPMLGLPDSAVQRACDATGVRFVAEGFADRAYTAGRRLVPRTQAGALITDPAAAAKQALALAGTGVGSICVHSDTPGAVAIVAAVSQALTADGYELQTFAQ